MHICCLYSQDSNGERPTNHVGVTTTQLYATKTQLNANDAHAATAAGECGCVRTCQKQHTNSTHKHKNSKNASGKRGAPRECAQGKLSSRKVGESMQMETKWIMGHVWKVSEHQIRMIAG